MAKVIPPNTPVWEDRPFQVRQVNVVGRTVAELREAKRRRVREHLSGGRIRFSYTGRRMRMTFLTEQEQRRENAMAISAGARRRLRSRRLK